MKIVVLDGQGVNPGDISWKQIEQFGTLTVYPRTDKNDVLRSCWRCRNSVDQQDGL